MPGKKDDAPEMQTTEITGAPAVVEPAPLNPGAGQVIVTSPTGIQSVVDDIHVEALKTQGYKVG